MRRALTSLASRCAPRCSPSGRPFGTIGLPARSAPRCLPSGRPFGTIGLPARSAPRCSPSGRPFGLAAALLCLAAGTAGCERALPGGLHNPFQSFEARCAKLPAAPPTVVAAPLAILEDATRSQHDLVRLLDGPAAGHQALGVTKARIGHDATLEIKGLKDPASGHACFRAHVRVELGLRPLTVYVAREIADDPCRREAIHAHEMKHVAVYAAWLEGAAGALAQALAAEFVDGVHYAEDGAAAQRALRERLEDFVRTHSETAGRELEARQRGVDSPEEYARVAAACGGTGATPPGR